MRRLNISASSRTDIFMRTSAPQRTGTHYSHTHARLHSPSIKQASKKSVTMICVYCSWHFVRSSLTWMWLINRVRHKKCKAAHIWRWDQQWSRAERRRAGPSSADWRSASAPERGLTGKAGVPRPITQAAGSRKYAFTNKQTSLRC